MKTSSILGLATALTLVAVPGFAQDAGKLEEIVVTATKREQTLQDVAVAVTVTSADTIKKAAIKDISDLASIVPSLRVTQLQTSTQTNFIIRGFGNGANNPGIEPSVGVFIDGVYRSRSASQIGDLVDISRVEVLRGPQSTLFGQNASAGVISITTQKPSFTWGGYLEGGIGSFNETTFKGKVTGPMSESTAFSLAGSYNQRDGYFNELLSGKKINDRNRWDLRGQVLWDVNDDLSVRVIGDTSKIDEKCCGVVNLLNGPTSGAIAAVGGKIYTGSPFDRSAYLNQLPSNLVRNDGVSLHLDWKLNDSTTLTSITSSRQQKAGFVYDIDFTSAALAASANDQKINTVTEELRLAYDNGSNLQALLGGYFFTEKVKYDNPINWGPAFRGYATGLLVGSGGSASTFPSLEAALGLPTGTFFANGTGGAIYGRQNNDAYTIFGQVDFKPIDRLTLTAGLAYTDTQKKVSITQFNNDVFSSLNFVQIGFGQIFGALTGGKPPTSANIAANPAAAAQADALSVRPCSAATGTACNSLLGLYPLQFLYPIVPFENQKSSDSKLTYTARAAYEFTDNLNGYASLATGFKATSWNLSRDTRPLPPATPDKSPLGGYNNPYYGRYGTRYASPEESTVYEIGLKGAWDRFAMNLAIFDQSIRGFQSNLFVGTGFVLGNAGKQSTQGIEIETKYKFSENWQFDVSGTFLDPKYDSFTGAQGPNGVVNLTGTRPSGVARETITLGAMYNWRMDQVDGFVRADYRYASSMQLVDNIPASIASQKINSVDASAGFTRDGWEFMLWGRNLTDNKYLLSAFPSVAQSGSVSGYPNQPRTYGITVRKNWSK